MASEITIKFGEKPIDDEQISALAYAIGKALDSVLFNKNFLIIKESELLQKQIFEFSNYLESRGCEMRDLNEVLSLYNTHFNIYDKRPSTQ
jgi:hypothetical protein